MAYDQILCLAFVSTFVLASGLRLVAPGSKPAPMFLEDCSYPPTNGHTDLCCRLPKERIWGDLRRSLRKCIGIIRFGEVYNDTMTTTAPTVQVEENTEVNNSELVTAAPGSGFFVMPVPRHPIPRRFYLSETATKVFTSIYKVIKESYDVLRNSVVMLTAHFHQRRSDPCIMECVFQEEGFLNGKSVNKEAILERIHITLDENEVWRNVAVEAIEKCFDTDLEMYPNSSCQSGSEQVFRCVFKHLFFNCPNWPQYSEYCNAVKEFHRRCPNGAIPDEDQSTLEPEDTATMGTPPGH